MKKVILAAAAAAMTFSGAASASEPLRASQAVPAAAKVSADAPVKRASKRSDKKMALNGTTLILGGFAIALTTYGIIQATQDDSP